MVRIGLTPFGVERKPVGFAETLRIETFQSGLALGIGGGYRAGIFAGGQLDAHFFGDCAAQAAFLQNRAINLGRPDSVNAQRQTGPFAEDLGNLLELLLFRWRQRVLTGFEGELLQLLATTAEQRTQCAERRGNDLGENVADGLPDNPSIAELRVVQAAGDR